MSSGITPPSLNHSNDKSKRIIICITLLIIGILAVVILSKFKKPPKEVDRSEPSLQVEVASVKAADFPSFIEGYGEIKPLTMVKMAPEVPGKIIEVHPDLEAGRVIPKGETLFKINPADYKIQVNWGKKRLDILKRNQQVALNEYERVVHLYETNNLGTQSAVDVAEKALLSAGDMVTQLSQAVEMAKLNLSRCTVKAPFNARIKTVSLEKGQYVSPGQIVMTLSDDSELEIVIGVDSKEAQSLLQFDEASTKLKSNWFHPLKPVLCDIVWTGKINREKDNNPLVWQGLLNRVVSFDSQARMVTIAIRISSAQGTLKSSSPIPLVEGMFCKVSIPGKPIDDVFELPRWAVSFENTVYRVTDNRLETVPVTVVYTIGDKAYIKGLNNNDSIIITRLVNPLENALVKITNKE